MSTAPPERPDPYAIELALAAALAEVTDGQAEKIARAWAAAWAEVAGDLQDALEVVLGDAGQVNTMAVVRYVRLATVLAAIADHLDNLVADLGVLITGDLAEVLGMATSGSLDLITAQLPFDFQLPDRPVLPDALTAIIDRVTQQVTSTALPLADETYAILLRELTRGVAAGDNPRETAARMVERAEDLHNFGRSRAENIARSETLDAYREAARVQQDQHADVLEGWVWLCHLGSRTCRSCLSMHGRLFPLEKPGPDDHPQGRCSRCPVVREEDGSFDLSWVPSADEHFATLTPDEQRKLLGRKGYDAWLAGEFPRDQWTKTRSSDGWRDAQVPAGPGDPGGGSGTGGSGGGGDDEGYRARALARFGQPPDDSDPIALRGYWLRRQGALPVNFKGDILKAHEVEFVERFLDAGEELSWIANDPARATSDFLWNGDAFELKSTKARYETIHGRIVSAASRAMKNHGVVKEHFLIDLGDAQLNDELHRALAGFNDGRRLYRLVSLWVMAGGELEEILLRK